MFKECARRLFITGSTVVTLAACQSVPGTPAPGLATVRGQVYGPDSGQAGLSRVIVRLGDRTTLTAAPDETNMLSAPDAAPPDPSRYPSIEHDFGDGHGPVLVERRPRQMAPGTSSGQEAYWYLRPGEFVLEGVPAGDHAVTASNCAQTSPPLPLRLSAGQTLEDVSLQLAHPQVIVDQGEAPALAEVVEILPRPRLSLWEAGYEVRDKRLNRAVPTPLEITVSLRAAQTSKALGIQAVSLLIQWTAAGQVQRQGPYRIALPPRFLGAGSDTCPGPVSRVTVPLSPAWFTEAAKEYGRADVTIEFLGPEGFPLQSPSLEVLQAHVTVSP